MLLKMHRKLGCKLYVPDLDLPVTSDMQFEFISR